MSSENPTTLVERVFSRIAATRMAGLPLNNPALRVEACGFRRWQDLWLGVLIAPWAINLMLLPGGSAAFRRLGPDEARTWTFPSGEYAFRGGEADGLGPYQSCSLFSPAFEFARHADARHAAQVALAVLLEAPSPRRAFLARLLPAVEQV